MSEQDPNSITGAWWVEGDMPARNGSRAAFLIDGRMTMLTMCSHFLVAKQSIYITAWGLTPELLLVRGKYHRAGPDGSPEQEELLAWLRSQGLTAEDLLFWQQSEALSVANVLSYVVSKGVDVRVLLWDTYVLPFVTGPKQVQETLEPLGVRCLLDDSHKGLLNHPIESHHQKTVVVDSRYAFVGGIDMMAEKDGDYDRWDTKGHHYSSPFRLNKDGKTPHCWHDVHVLFEGPPVADVLRNFRERWNAVIEQHKMDEALLLLPEPLADAPAMASVKTGEAIRMQVVRTVPDTYKFVPEGGIATILAAYQRAFAQAQRSIYIENQYFWRRTFLGFENPLLGLPHADMEQLLQTLADALARGVSLTLVLPDNPNLGREFTDDGLNYLWEIAPRAVAAGALQVYTLATSELEKPAEDAIAMAPARGATTSQVEKPAEDAPKHMRYRPIYVHGKVTIVDDTWMTLGSANLNNRGMRDDTEMNVAILHPRMAQGLRILLMAEHLGLCDEDTLFRIVEVMGRVQPSSELDSLSDDIAEKWEELKSQLGDPFAGMALFAQQARANLEATKASQPLIGHLLPYIPYSRAQDYEIKVNAVNGWIDPLPDAELPVESSTGTESEQVAISTEAETEKDVSDDESEQVRV